MPVDCSAEKLKWCRPMTNSILRKRSPKRTGKVPRSHASPTPATATELSSGTILTQNKNSVVKILVTVPQGQASGSGVVWQDASHVLTNAHVVVGGAAIKVVVPNDGARTFPAKVVALSSCDDVALLRANEQRVPVMAAEVNHGHRFAPSSESCSIDRGISGTSTPSLSASHSATSRR